MTDKRRVFEKGCDKCFGSGKTSVISKRICTECNGPGWVDVNGKATLCVTCKGEGNLIRTINKTCPACKGRGNIPCIVDVISTEKIECGLCSGTGKISRWICKHCGPFTAGSYKDYNGTILCSKCDGLGYDITINCETCEGSGSTLIDTLRDTKTGKTFTSALTPTKSSGDENDNDVRIHARMMHENGEIDYREMKEMIKEETGEDIEDDDLY